MVVEDVHSTTPLHLSLPASALSDSPRATKRDERIEVSVHHALHVIWFHPVRRPSPCGKAGTRAANLVAQDTLPSRRKIFPCPPSRVEALRENSEKQQLHRRRAILML